MLPPVASPASPVPAAAPVVLSPPQPAAPSSAREAANPKSFLGVRFMVFGSFIVRAATPRSLRWIGPDEFIGALPSLDSAVKIHARLSARLILEPIKLRALRGCFESREV